jgi:hypothetical protein
MKKIFKLFVLIVLSISCAIATGCGCFIDYKTDFFKQSHLRGKGIEDLQAPDYEYDDSLFFATSLIWGYIELDAFEEYAQYVHEFLQEHFRYVGFCGERYPSMFSGYCSLVECEEGLENFRTETENKIEYEFFYYDFDYDVSTYVEGHLSTPRGYVIILEYFFEESTIKNKKSNFRMEIDDGEYYYNGSYNDTDDLNVQIVPEPYKKHGDSHYDSNKFSYPIIQYYKNIDSSSNQNSTNYMASFVAEYLSQYGERKSDVVNATLKYEPEYFDNNILLIECVYLQAGQNARLIGCWAEIEGEYVIYSKYEFYDDESITEPMNLFFIIELPQSILDFGV